jgi:pimeloyl-ACP methyl ester carboxylesterase
MSPPAPALDRSRLVPLSFGRLWLTDLWPHSTGSGADPPCLLVHDFALCEHTWSRVVPELARARRVLAPDLPGAGNSDRPDPRDADGYSLEWLADRLLELLDAIDVRTVDLVGHGLGGSIAAVLAARRPGALRRLELVAPVCFSMASPLAAGLRGGPLGRLLPGRRIPKDQFRDYVARQYSTPELLDAARLEVYWDRLTRPGGEAAVMALGRRFGRLEGVAAALERVEVRTTFVWGDRDLIVPVDDAPRAAALVRGARLHVLDGCGHSPHEEMATLLAF